MFSNIEIISAGSSSFLFQTPVNYFLSEIKINHAFAIVSIYTECLNLSRLSHFRSHRSEVIVTK